MAALQKWAGVIGYCPVTVTTDHKSLENWTTEKTGTPSGPRGRRARWHSTLAQFDLKVEYVPGPENVVADAMSRWANPASSAREDVSSHGSALARDEVHEIMKKEREDEETLENGQYGTRNWVVDPEPPTQDPRAVAVVTRGGVDTEDPLDTGDEGGDPEEPSYPTYVDEDVEGGGEHDMVARRDN